MMKHVFTVRVTIHWHKLHREVLEPPSCEILKSHLDMVLGNHYRQSSFTKEARQDDLQRHFPNSTIL